MENSGTVGYRCPRPLQSEVSGLRWWGQKTRTLKEMRAMAVQLMRSQRGSRTLLGKGPELFVLHCHNKNNKTKQMLHSACALVDNLSEAEFRNSGWIPLLEETLWQHSFQTVSWLLLASLTQLPMGKDSKSSRMILMWKVSGMMSKGAWVHLK